MSPESTKGQSGWEEIIGKYHESFYFDPTEKFFVIAGQEVSIDKDKDPNSMFTLFRRTTGELTAEPEKDFMTLGPWSNIYALPKLREWLKDISRSQERYQVVANEVKSAMRLAAKLTDPSLSDFLLREDDYNPTSIGVNFNETGEFTLITYGNCACLSRNPDGDFCSWESNEGVPTEYWIHNVDMPAQLNSLYAGAGTLAWLAAQEKK